MKVLGFLAVLAAGFVGIASGPAQAMPVKLSFSGSILDPSGCGAIFANCDPAFYEGSPGGIFAAGQSVSGSFVYDPGSLTSTSVTASGSVSYRNTTRDLVITIASNSGPYVADFTGSAVLGLGSTFICGVPTCLLSTGEQFVTISDQSPTAFPPEVVGTFLLAGGVSFWNDKDLLSSSALLPAEELLPVIEQSRQFLFLAFLGLETDKCRPELCFVMAEISVDVPAPEGAGLMGIGLVGMFALRRRRTASA